MSMNVLFRRKNEWQRRFHFTMYYIWCTTWSFSFRFFIWYLFRFVLLCAPSLVYQWEAGSLIIMWVYCNTLNDFCCWLCRLMTLTCSISVYSFASVRLHFLLLLLFDSCAPHSVSFWFVSYDTITNRVSNILLLFLFLFRLLVLLLSFIRARAHIQIQTQSNTILWNAKKGVLLFTLFVCSRTFFIHGTFSNSSFLCCILE